MTAKDIEKLLDGKLLSDSEGEIERFYAGDFLSRVMGKAPEGCGWMTVMNNLNVAGVAALAGIKLIILCEGVMASEELQSKCRQEGIGLLLTDKPVYECCKLV